jgi:hypothetical protein
MPGHRNLVSPPRLQGMLTEVHLHKRPVTTSSSEHQAASRGVGAGQATPARRQRRCRRAPGPRCPVATRRRQVPGDDGCGPAHAPGAASGVRGLRARGRAGAWSAAGPSAARAQEARVRAGVPRGAWRPWVQKPAAPGGWALAESPRSCWSAPARSSVLLTSGSHALPRSVVPGSHIRVQWP